MPGYRLSRTALREVGKIIGDLHDNISPDVASATERQFFSVFADLGRLSAMGHPRPDLTIKQLLFHFSKPYMIAFRRQAGRAMIVRVVHGSRDLSKLL